MKKDPDDFIKVRSSVTFGPKIKEWAEEYCKENEKSLSALINDLLREFLEKNYPKRKSK